MRLTVTEFCWPRVYGVISDEIDESMRYMCTRKREKRAFQRRLEHYSIWRLSTHVA